VWARANASGELVADEGRVEIRYKPNDGRRYGARKDNLSVIAGEVLPEETCGPAEVVTAPKRELAEGAKAKKTAHVPKAAPAGAVIVYADGACSGNPGPAGLGVVIIDGAQRIELSEFLGQGTNNIAELTAILRALDELGADRAAVIHTDSQYSIGVLQKGWKAKANVELVLAIKAVLATRKAARLVYVPGHAGVLLNERADELAREAVTTRSTRRAVLGGRSTSEA
jgi:ribonuclease HI